MSVRCPVPLLPRSAFHKLSEPTSPRADTHDYSTTRVDSKVATAHTIHMARTRAHTETLATRMINVEDNSKEAMADRASSNKVAATTMIPSDRLSISNLVAAMVSPQLDVAVAS
jgi:hypothetical protein